MKEADRLYEDFNNKEHLNAVFNNTLLLNHESASNYIKDKVAMFPINKIVVFGEPGANKTTIMLQMAGELAKIIPNLEPKFTLFDDALAKVKENKGDQPLIRKDFKQVSQLMTDEIYRTEDFINVQDSTKRYIQFIELVGISLKDRGVSTLRNLANNVNQKNIYDQDTLVIGVAADERSLKDAGEVRKVISELQNPMDLYPTLSNYNMQITLDKNINLKDENVAKKIIRFFGNMASDERIEVVHNEVLTQGLRRAGEDENILFKMLSLPDNLPVPITDRLTRRNYLINAAFLQTYLHELGLKPKLYKIEPDLIKDNGVVIFSPYNPNVIKHLDLSKVLSHE